MTTCCFFLSLRTGCLLAVPIYLGSAIAKIVLLLVFPIPEGPQAIITMNIVMLIITGSLLLVGVLKEDRVCIITFLCFNTSALAIQAIGILIQYVVILDAKITTWVLVVILVENVPFVYMIPIGILEFRYVKEKHLHRVEDYHSASAQIPSKSAYRPHQVTSTIPALGV